MNFRYLVPVMLLGLVACSPSSATGEADTAVATSGTPASAAAIAVSVADFMIDPDAIEATGPTVTFDVTNDGPTPHNFTVRDVDGQVVMATADLAVGASETITADLEPGEYEVFCSLAGHESLGMSGTLTVDG